QALVGTGPLRSGLRHPRRVPVVGPVPIPRDRGSVVAVTDRAERSTAALGRRVDPNLSEAGAYAGVLKRFLTRPAEVGMPTGSGHRLCRLGNLLPGVVRPKAPQDHVAHLDPDVCGSTRRHLMGTTKDVPRQEIDRGRVRQGY